MADDLFPIKNKIEGLSYAFTLNGIELPVLDITHPGFTSCTDEKILHKMLPYVEKNAEKNAEKFNKIPVFIKRYLAKRSFTMAELLHMGEDSSYASGITTIMMKLGPNLIGKGKKRFWDRQVNKGFGSLVIRLRARDNSDCQAETIIKNLKDKEGKDLCFINIAGGAASDTINTLILIRKDHPELLENRKIEINVLDIDYFGPVFAENSINALKSQGGKFDGLDVTFRHFHYDWNNPEKLSELLSARKEWIQICSSEGGLFEYCTDEVIIQNLDAISRDSNNDVIVTGTLLHNLKTIDAGIQAALKISTSIKPRFLGIDGLNSIIENRNWKIECIKEGNPRYLTFSLKRKVN